MDSVMTNGFIGLSPMEELSLEGGGTAGAAL